MASSEEKELGDTLIEIGNKLLNPPTSIDELLDQLDILELNLSKVEQAPPIPLQDALLPAMKALIANELSQHTDTDVKISLASCINEITRITAPDAPYNDEQMKECFRLTVSAFGKLSHVTSRSYTKAVLILDTFAKVRSCLMMLDLECDALVIEMFQLFLKIIRSSHPYAIFENMESIMTLIIEESDDISPELLNTLLDSVKKENQNALPMSLKLGEKIISNCSFKLKPHLMNAVESLTIDLNDYAPSVSSMCKTISSNLEQTHVRTSEEQMVITELAQAVVCPGEISLGLEDIKNTTQTKVDEASAHKKNRKGGLGSCCQSKNSKSSDKKNNNDESDNVKIVEPIKSVFEPETVLKKRGRKPNSLMNPEEGYDHSWSTLSRRKKKRDKATIVEDSPSETLLSPREKTLQENQNNEGLPKKKSRVRKRMNIKKQDDADKDSASKFSTLIMEKSESIKKMSQNVTVDCSSPTANQNLAHGSTKKRRIQKKGGTGHQVSDKNSSSVQNEHLHSVKKEVEDNVLENTLSDLKVTNGNVLKEKGFSDCTVGGKKKGRPKKSITGVFDEKNMVGSATASINERGLDATPKKEMKRKRTPGKREGSKTPHSVEDLDERLIGSKIRVWWPKDKVFYDGVIFSFDNAKKKHKIVYTDGDEEVLNLAKQRWELTKDGIKNDASNHEGPFDEAEKKEKQNLETTPIKRLKLKFSSMESSSSERANKDDNPLVLEKSAVSRSITKEKPSSNTHETSGIETLTESANDANKSLKQSRKKRNKVIAD